MLILSAVGAATDSAAGTASAVSGEVTSVASGTTSDGFDIVQDIKDGVTGIVTEIMDFLPNLFMFLLILLGGYFVAKLIGRGVRKLLKKINFDYYVDKSGLGAPLERAGFKDSGRFAGKVVYVLILLFVWKIAFEALGVSALEEPFNELIAWIPKALIALVLIVIGGIVANTVRDAVRAVTMGQSYSSIVTKIAFVSVWLIFGLAALDQIQIGQDLVDTLTTVILSSIGAILVIKFGVGGIWAARDRFWPAVYDSLTSSPPAPKPDTQRPPSK